MARPTANQRKGRDQVAAALDTLDESATGITRAAAVVRQRLETLEETVGELEARVVELEAGQHDALQSLKDSHLEEVTALRTRLEIAEEKLRKVQSILP